MATRPAFYVDEISETVRMRNAHFEWFPGFSLAQKQRSINALHKALEPSAALEISSKSPDPLGQSLSAFNLSLYGFPLECIFQGSKVYQYGGPFREHFNWRPKDAKRDPRHQSSGKLIAFELMGYKWDLTPATAFYDYIYLRAVRNCIDSDKLEKLNNYRYFTDIEFNPQKSINCQARSVALYKLTLKKFGELPTFSQKEWIDYHKCVVKG